MNGSVVGTRMLIGSAPFRDACGRFVFDAGTRREGPVEGYSSNTRAGISTSARVMRARLHRVRWIRWLPPRKPAPPWSSAPPSEQCWRSGNGLQTKGPADARRRGTESGADPSPKGPSGKCPRPESNQCTRFRKSLDRGVCCTAMSAVSVRHGHEVASRTAEYPCVRGVRVCRGVDGL